MPKNSASILSCLLIVFAAAAIRPSGLLAADDTRRETLLARAHEQLIKDAAKPLTKFLNDRADKQDRVALDQIITQAQDAITEYRAIDKESEQETSAMASRARMFEVFANIFDAIATFDESEDATSRLTDAAIELELYVDVPNKNVAEAARLWQSLAYRLAGKPERSLKILFPILRPGTRSPIDLYCRFERCRALSQSGQHVAGIALAIRTTKIARDWPGASGPAHREPVLAAKQLVADMYRNWAAALTKQGETDRANDANQRAQKLESDVDEGTFDEKFRLTRTIVGLDSE